MSDSVRIAIHFFVNFDIFKWLYLAYFWVYLHQTWGFCKASSSILDTFSDQHSLSRAAALATFQLFHPALFLSLSTVLLQVVFGLPLAFCPSGVHPNAIKQSFSPSHLSTCPNQFHFLLHTSQLISLISAISTTLLFVTLYCHVIFVIRLRHWHWKLFSFCSSAFVIFHVSQP